MKFKLFFLFVLFFNVLFISGCSSEGINEKLIIHGIGVDKEEDKYVVTMHVLNTNALSDEGGNKEEKIEVISRDGYTLLDAIANIEKSSGKKALYSHNLILVVGKETAGLYMDKILSFFSSDYNLRPSVEVLISQTTAKDVLNIKNDDKLITADDIMSMLETSYNKEDQLKFALKSFLGDMQSDYKSAKAFCISSTQDVLESYVLQISNMAVFKDKVMKGILDEDETKGFLEISGELKNVEQDVTVDGNNLSCLIKKSKCKIKTLIEDGTPQFNIFIKATVNVYNDNLRDNENIKPAIEKKLCELANKSINRALIEYECDIFNFSRHLMNANINYFKSNRENITDLLVNAKYYINIDAQVNCMGKNSSLFEE